MCWSESPSARPTAQELLSHLQDTSRTWVPPPEYPIPNDHDERTGLDLSSDDELSIAVTGALASCLFVLVVSALCALLFSNT